MMESSNSLSFAPPLTKTYNPELGNNPPNPKTFLKPITLNWETTTTASSSMRRCACHVCEALAIPVI